MKKKITVLKVFFLLLLIGVLVLAAIYLSPYVYLMNKSIVFYTSDSYEDEGLSLYRWGILTPLTSPNLYVSSAKWSPDEMKIALAYSLERGGSEIHFGILDVQTHQITPIAHFDESVSLSYQYPGEPYLIRFAWSPDGGKILYSVPVSKDHQQLNIFDLQTGETVSTSISLDSIQGEEEVHLYDLAWDPGPIPLASVSFENVNPSYPHTHKLFLIDDKFTKLIYVIDGSESSWLPDGKTIIYECITNSRSGTCAYSVENLSQTVIATDFPLWQSSSNGLLLFGWHGGGEGDKTYLAVYNVLFHMEYRLPFAFSNLFRGGFILP